MFDLKDESKTLGLQWKMFFQITPWEATCRVISSRVNGSHAIMIDRFTRDDPEGRRPLLRQILCRCLLAERIDPIFATAYVDDEEIDKEMAKNIAFSAEMPLNFWADQIRHKYWPEDSLLDNMTSLEDITKVINHENGDRFIDANRELSLVFALVRAEMKKFKLDLGDLRHLMRELYPDTQSTIKRLEDVLVNLPDLALNKDEDLSTLEEATKSIIEIWGFDIHPYLEYSSELQGHSWKKSDE